MKELGDILKEKKKWESPELFLLGLKQTEGGAPPNTYEGTPSATDPGGS